MGGIAFKKALVINKKIIKSRLQIDVLISTPIKSRENKYISQSITSRASIN